MTASDTGSVTVRFHQALYAAAAITEAADTFARFASFAIRSEGEHHVVEVSAIACDVDGDVVAEFCNFALANSARAERSDHD
jgi:hypothetical protein